MSDPYDKAAQLLARAKHVVGFTGAGMSSESGIPTFRDPGGVWDQFSMDEVGTPDGLLRTLTRAPEKIREFVRSTVKTFESSAPNPGHYALAELERMGKLQTVITQNVDNLHSEAGNTHVIEVHGNMYRARCIKCGKKQKLKSQDVLGKAREVVAEKEFNLLNLAKVFPACSCGSITRPDVVMFGEAVQGMQEAYQACVSCDVMIILGTSGVVYPAAGLPFEARRNGARIIEMNPTTNSFSQITDVFIKERSGEGMPKVLSMVRRMMEG